jgi:hypothetical protein
MGRSERGRQERGRQVRLKEKGTIQTEVERNEERVGGTANNDGL